MENRWILILDTHLQFSRVLGKGFVGHDGRMLVTPLEQRGEPGLVLRPMFVHVLVTEKRGQRPWNWTPVAGRLDLQVKWSSVCRVLTPREGWRRMRTYVYHDAFSSLGDFGESVIDGGDIGDDRLLIRRWNIHICLEKQTAFLIRF